MPDSFPAAGHSGAGLRRGGRNGSEGRAAGGGVCDEGVCATKKDPTFRFPLAGPVPESRRPAGHAVIPLLVGLCICDEDGSEGVSPLRSQGLSSCSGVGVGSRYVLFHVLAGHCFCCCRFTTSVQVASVKCSVGDHTDEGTLLFRVTEQ